MIRDLRLPAKCASSLLLVLLAGCPQQQQADGPPAGDRAAQGPLLPIAPDAEDPAGSEKADLPPTPTGLRFKDVAAESGVQFIYRNGEEAGRSSILESLGGGVGILDFDRDGLPDLCFPGGGSFSGTSSLSGHFTGLFRNRGAWQFEDVSVASGIQPCRVYSHGVAAADYDADGFCDVLITGYGGLHLWRNLGDGAFAEVHEIAGLHDDQWSSSAAWGDFNGDGSLDLYVAHYVDWSFDKDPFCPGPADAREICSPRKFQGLTDTLYISQNDGAFRDETVAAGLAPEGKGLGVLACDLDADGDLDVYVANDTVENFLYVNDGSGKFEENALLAGVAMDHLGIPNGSMGVDMCDFNRDGLTDIWVANYERESFALYRNEGQGVFLHVSQSTGITALGGLYVAFGTAAFDADRDGDEDMLVANGHVIKYPRGAPRKQQPLLLENQNASFRRIRFPADSYFSQAHEGRGLACGDLDGDGDLDFVVSHLNVPAALLRNDSEPAGGYVAVELVGVRSPREGIGARLVLHTTQGDLLRNIRGGASYLSQNQSIAFWGVPSGAAVTGLTIYWPSGAKQELTQVALNSKFAVIEPREESQGVPLSSRFPGTPSDSAQRARP